MICPKDITHEVVENEAFHKKFFYCRDCKDEVEAKPEPKKDDLYKYWTGMTTATGSHYVIDSSSKVPYPMHYSHPSFIDLIGCNNDDCDLCNPKGAA